MLERYDADAHMNCLNVDIHREENIIEFFSGSILDAGEKYLESPRETPFIPNWMRVISAEPDVPERILAAVELDNT
jgi:glucosyl-3-phosphoglycerate synthase